MANTQLSLSVWALGLVGLTFTWFFFHLIQLGFHSGRFDWRGFPVLAGAALTALWGWLGLAHLLSSESAWLAASALADLLRYGCWFIFLLGLLRPQKTQSFSPAMAWLVPIASALVLGALAAQFLTLGDRSDGTQASRFLMLCNLLLPVLGLVMVEQVFRNLPEDSLWNAKPLCLGLAGVFLFDIYLYSQAVLFNRLDEDAMSIRGLVNSFMMPLLMLATTRRRDWISKLHISRQAAFHSATLLLAGAYLLFISVVGYYVRYFGGEWGRALQLGMVVLALTLLMVLALSGSFRARLKVLLGKHFFRYRYDYREEWLRFTKTLSHRRTPGDMGIQVVRGMADLLESPAGCLWLKTKDDLAYAQAAQWNMKHCEALEEASSGMVQFLRNSGWVINLEEFRSFPQRYGNLSLPQWLAEVEQAWLLVPLSAGDDLIGFVLLSSSRTPMDVNWEVNDLLKTAGTQAAVFMAQMQATEALLEARKFDAFNRMSAFVVHDLKNIVTQLSLMMKNAKRLHANPEFQQDMLMTVENSLDRMRQLMLQLREGATPVGTALGVDLEAIVRRIEAVALGRGRTLHVELGQNVTTRGHEDRLERVIGHVVQNAFDATEPSGRVWLKLSRQSGLACLEVGDTGKGMSQEFIRDRLFKPFQTTKDAGMGIGAYESFQYVQELGGKIEVQSELNQGTRITLLLPLFELQKQSDLLADAT